jgi:DNA-binding beta-propeller fold protein YncE
MIECPSEGTVMRAPFVSGVILLTLGAFAPAGPVVQARALPYAAAGDIAIGGAGAFDYLNVDSAAGRLYVSHGTEVVVIDTAARRVVGRIADTPGVHGIAIAPELDRVFTTNGRENAVGIFDRRTLAPIGKVPTGGANPDAILYDPSSKHVWAFNHTGHSATTIDAATGKVLATIPLSGTAESGVADPALKRVFVNIEDKGEVDVIDTTTNTVVAIWPVGPGTEPTGLAIDAAAHRLLVGAGAFMVMIDATTGKVVASVPICDGTDATWFDPGTQLAFSSCGDGHITIAHLDSPAKLTVVQTLETTRGARTMALDLGTHRIYTAAQRYQPADPNAPPAAPGARGRGPAAIPDSFHVLVYAMAP